MHIDEVLHSEKGNGCLCPRTYIQPNKHLEQTAYINEEESRKRTLEVLKFIRGFSNLEKSASRIFKSTSKESQELREVIEKYVRPL